MTADQARKEEIKRAIRNLESGGGTNGSAGINLAYAQARRHFDEKALVDLTLAVVAINGWNRMNVAFRTKVGDYVSPHAKAR